MSENVYNIKGSFIYKINLWKIKKKEKKKTEEIHDKC